MYISTSQFPSLKASVCVCDTIKEINILLYLYGSIALVRPWLVFWFIDTIYTVSINHWMKDQPLAKPLPANRNTQTQNKLTQTFMPQVVFEPTIPVIECAKDSLCLRPCSHCIRQFSHPT
jgi:hypothetical protein